MQSVMIHLHHPHASMKTPTGADLAAHLNGGPLTAAQSRDANATAKKDHLATFSDDVRKSYEDLAEGYYAIGRRDIAAKLESLISQLDDMRVLDKQPVYYMLKVFLLTIGRPEDQPIRKSVVEVPTGVLELSQHNQREEEVEEDSGFEGEHWNFENDEVRGFTDSEDEQNDDYDMASEDTDSTPMEIGDTGVPLSLRDFVLPDKDVVVKTLQTEWTASQITLVRECLFLLQGLECNITPAHSGHVEQIIEISASLELLRDVTLQLEASSLPKLSFFVQELVELMRDVHTWLYTVEKVYLNKDLSGLAVSLNDFRTTVSTRLGPEMVLSGILSGTQEYKNDPGLLLDAFDDARTRTLDSTTMKMFDKLYKAVLRDILAAGEVPVTQAAASQAYVHLLTKIHEAQMFAIGSSMVLPEEGEFVLEGDNPDELLLNLQVELRNRYQRVSEQIMSEMHTRNVFSSTLTSLSHFCFYSVSMSSLAEWMTQEIIGGSKMWRSQRYINYELEGHVRVHITSRDQSSIIETLGTFHLAVKPTIIQSKGDLQALSNLWTLLLQVKMSVSLLSRSECVSQEQYANRHTHLNTLYLVAAFFDFDVCRPLLSDFTKLHQMKTLELLLGEHSRVMAWLKRHKEVFELIQQLLLDIESGDDTTEVKEKIRKEEVVQGSCLALI